MNKYKRGVVGHLKPVLQIRDLVKVGGVSATASADFEKDVFCTPNRHTEGPFSSIFGGSSHI